MASSSPLTVTHARKRFALMVVALAAAWSLGSSASVSADSGIEGSKIEWQTAQQSIAAGYGNTCAITSTGGVKCWGRGFYGEMGNGAKVSSSSPVDVIGLSSGVKQISGYARTFCALLSDATVKCWGDNYFSSDSNTTLSEPTVVAGLSNVTQVSAGDTHMCVVVTGGAVKCIGDNGEGQLGNGLADYSIQLTPQTPIASGAKAVYAGYYATCAIMLDGSTKCWGSNGSSEAGTGSSSPGKVTTPATVTVVTGQVAALTQGYARVCVIMTSSGAVKCWGDSTEPTGVSAGISAVSATEGFSCVLTTAGGVKCWGNNSSGLGDGSSTSSSTPVDVSGLSSGVIALTVGEIHAVAVMSDGTLKCWGSNSNGEFGIGNTTSSATPVECAPGVMVSATAASSTTTTVKRTTTTDAVAQLSETGQSSTTLTFVAVAMICVGAVIVSRRRLTR